MSESTREANTLTEPVNHHAANFANTNITAVTTDAKVANRNNLDISMLFNAFTAPIVLYFAVWIDLLA